MDLVIRKALPEDTYAIWKLNCDEMGYDFPLEATKDSVTKLLQSDRDKIFVAVVDDQVVGYVHANDYDLTYFPHMKNIMGIAVNGDYKRMGIGRALLCQVEEWAISTDAAGIRLVSGAARLGAHAFYRKCGFSGDKEQLNLKKMF